MDLWARGAAVRPPGTGLTLVASAMGLGLLGVLGSTRAARVAIALVVGTTLFVQAFATAFQVPFDTQATLAARASWVEVVPILAEAKLKIAVVELIIVGVELALLELAAMWTRPALRLRLAAPLLFTVVVGPGLDRRTPEYQALAGLLALTTEKTTVTAPRPEIPPLESTRPQLPSVLFILTESVRAADYCSAPAPTCVASARVNRLLPERIALPTMRSLATLTHVSSHAVFTARPQTGTANEVAAHPSVFDLVAAVRRGDQSVHVAYYGDHWRAGVFERDDAPSSCDRFVSLDDLPEADRPGDRRDHALVDRFVREIGDVPAASFTVLHLFGTHVPYFFDEETAPYRPYARNAFGATREELHNAYLDAIDAQDAEIARAVSAFLSSRGGAPAIVLFTSDHGEAFGEHGALHHGQNLYDEQIHVPGFVAATPGALSDAEIAALRVRAAGPTSHADLLPTVLDLFGVWGTAEATSFESAMMGSSLLRDPPEVGRAVPMTNCSAVRPCAVSTWGMLGDDRAIVAEPRDLDWRCVRLDGRGTPVRLDRDDACAALVEASRGYFPWLPSGAPF